MGPAPSPLTWPQRTRRTGLSSAQRPMDSTQLLAQALLPLGQPAQPMEAQDLPADLRPVLVIKWDPTRPWHPSHSATQHQVRLWAPRWWIPGLGASRARLHMSTSSEPQPATCERCAASWQPNQTLSASSGPPPTCTDSCHGEAASLVIRCCGPDKSPGFICLLGLLRSLQLAMIDGHVSLLHAKKKKGPPSACPHMAMSTAASGSLRRARQPDKQPRARLHSLISQSSQGPHESEGPQTPPQMLPGCIPPGRGRHHSFFSFKNGEGLLTCLSIIANRKRLSNPDRQIKQTIGDCRVHSTSYDKGSCFAMA